MRGDPLSPLTVYDVEVDEEESSEDGHLEQDNHYNSSLETHRVQPHVHFPPPTENKTKTFTKQDESAENLTW